METQTGPTQGIGLASPSVVRMIDELVRVVQATPRSTVVQVVADIDVAHEPVPAGRQDRLGETLEIDGVRIIRVENRPEPFIENEPPRVANRGASTTRPT